MSQLQITSYELQILGEDMNQRAKKTETAGKDDKKKPKVVMMACCPEGEDKAITEELKDEICIKLGKDLGDRGNVVMTRLDDADLRQIDALVEVEAFKSRSEAAAFFIKQGIQARKDLFEKVMPTVEKIRELKEQAQKELSKKEPHGMEVKK
jgi:Arc/MetJ-type ribon-helix-helix transcriptional regulator